MCMHADALLTVRLSLLWVEHQTLSINEAGEGVCRDSVHLKTVIFQVDRGQRGAGVPGVTDAPPPQRPAQVT